MGCWRIDADVARTAKMLPGRCQKQGIEMYVSIDGDKPITFESFADANDFTPEERAEIIATLNRGEIYHGGGGAGAEFTVERRT
jgi:hypothetical protein